ncbi:hypothetical protein [Candidatus Vondammii sp. HM_W22]|uniref:hypothetical protein n=1 Tax=Candidatus Vondammii sp. HM_W22 TaxID=2687299 RepID=UPI001F145989|nr:hypothetical protein [Candidatus Vondammii sp. HM_W22]
MGTAGASGYGLGTVLNKMLLEGTEASDQIGKALAHVAAFFGSEEAKNSIAMRERYEQAQRGELVIRLEGDGASSARVQQMRSDNLDLIDR